MHEWYEWYLSSQQVHVTSKTGLFNERSKPFEAPDEIFAMKDQGQIEGIPQPRHQALDIVHFNSGHSAPTPTVNNKNNSCNTANVAHHWQPIDHNHYRNDNSIYHSMVDLNSCWQDWYFKHHFINCWWLNRLVGSRGIVSEVDSVHQHFDISNPFKSHVLWCTFKAWIV